MTMRRGAINDALERGDTRWLLHWIGAERQLTHDPNPALARHAATLSLISGPIGARSDLEVAEGHPVVAALACRVAYDGVARIEPAEEPMIILPSSVG